MKAPFRVNSLAVASRPMTPQTRAGAVRSHWAIRNSLHRVPDVTFGMGKAQSRTGYGPANMATVRHCAFNILKAAYVTRSLKSRRTKAERNPEFMASITGQTRQPGVRAGVRICGLQSCPHPFP
ncbi:MAG: transposase [Rhodobacter sp.]|nr:transposase [Rhodobacter sp.]